MTDDAVRSVSRALCIMEAFLEKPVATLSELAAATGVSKTTCHRLLNTLISAHYVVRAPHGVGYQLGGKVIALGQACMAQVDVFRATRPHIVELARRTGDTAFMCINDDDEALCLDRVDGKHEVRVFILHLGGRQPLHVGAAPLALLADKTDDELAELVRRRGLARYTPYTIIDLKHLIAAVEHLRQEGYVVSWEDATIGVAAVGAPVFDHTDRVVASISVSGILPRFGPDRLPLLIEAVKEAAANASRDLGHSRTTSSEQRR
ncbi:MAG: IclR family transcriptional regulator [Chloroflexi bacterium]|nr:IclR family transcriptional regulator [Chloroflexota bacterium]